MNPHTLWNPESWIPSTGNAFTIPKSEPTSSQLDNMRKNAAKTARSAIKNRGRLFEANGRQVVDLEPRTKFGIGLPGSSVNANMASPLSGFSNSRQPTPAPVCAVPQKKSVVCRTLE